MVIKFDIKKETDKRFLKHVIGFLEIKVVSLELEIAGLRSEKQEEEIVNSILLEELSSLRERFFKGIRERNPKAKNTPQEKNGKSKLIHNENENSDSSTGKKEDALEIEEKCHTLDTKEDPCACCGQHTLREMKNCYEETSEIHVIPQRFVVRLNRSYKYSCTNCSNITTAKVPLKLRPGAEHTMEMAVETIIAKFEDHMPLERQRKQMHREGLNISVKTLYGLTQHVYDLLSKDLIFLIRKDIFSNRWVHIDESPMPFYNPKKSSGYVFSISNKNASLFIFEPNRNQQIIAEILQGYQGVVVTDGLNIYNNIDKVPGIVHALCWAHVRRKFIEALQFNPMAQEMIDMIGQLYEVERNAKTMNELESLRAERSKKILDQINDWIYRIDGGYLENSAFGKAMQYYKLRKDKLSIFITNKNVPIDNNQAERQQRCPVMGRKNFLHFKSITGADTGTFFYSVVESCKINKLNPREYLLEMGRLKLQNKTLLSPYEYAKNLRQENKSLSSVKKIDDLVMVS